MIRHASLFSQLIALFNRHQFYSLVVQHKAERYAKGFNSWDQFVPCCSVNLLKQKASEKYAAALPVV